MEGKEQSIKYLEKPFEEYLRCQAEIFVGTKLVINSKIKCFLWLPKGIIAEQPHVYFFIDNQREYKYFESLNVINLKINITTLDGKPHESYLIKEAYFSNSEAVIIAENWYEALIKYHFPKYTVKRTIINSKLDNKFRFYISESELFSSSVRTNKNYSGEVSRKIISKITLDEEVSHLGIKSLTSDKYIGEKEANILEITSHSPVNSLLAFYKIIKSTVDLILLLTSFAERRRLNWCRCDGIIGVNFVENFNTRVTFYQDRRVARLISKQAFDVFLKKTLKSIAPHDVKYITRLLRSYLSGIDYSVNAKIILWSSILEKILKKRFNKKNDKCKKDLLQAMSVYTSDLSINDLIDIRNDIAHGDEINSDKLFKLTSEWQILIERVLLKELKWDNLSQTDVHINGIKPFGL